SRRLPGGARRRRAAFPPALRTRAAGAQPAAGRQRRARARSGAAVRTGQAGTGARDIAGAGAGAVDLRRGTATLRAAGHRPVRYPPGRRPGLAGTAGAAAGTSRRRGGAPLRPAARSASGTGDAARARGRSGRGAHRHAPAPPDLAAGAPHSPARPGADRAGRARTHRIGLVGWRRPASRLLRGAHRQRPARLGVLPRRRARAVDAAWLVRMKVVSLAARVRDAGSSGRQPPEPKLPGYAELHCLSHFSFGRGASSALELFRRARQQGYAALAITDECSLAGIVRAWEASKETELPLITGSEFTLGDGLKLVLLVEDEAGYSRPSRLITLARMRCEEGHGYRLHRSDFDETTDGLLALWIPGAAPDAGQGCWLRERFPGRAWLAVELHRGPDDDTRLRQLLDLAAHLQLPAVAAGDAHMHVRSRRALQDLLTALRLRRSVAEAGDRLFPNGERHLRTRRALSAIYPRELLEESLRIAGRCRFRLDSLRYRYPRELVPEGHTPSSWLRELTEAGMRRRWPQGTPPAVRERIESE